MRPLPFVWPYLLLFWGVHLWAFWPEFRIMRTARRTATAQDAKSLQVITYGMWIGYFGAYAMAWVPALQIHAHRAAVFSTGVLLVVAGSLLRRHCWRMLGVSFTGDVRANEGQEIITRGAYAFLRHPSYTAGTLMNVGIGVALGSWASALVLLVVSVAVYLHRIEVEERALLAVLGEPYARFARTRKRLIPFIY
ncbi:MAG TPA: isoprenylcysteine carboxylmethyltransferase family protein [Candidatus Polarisedimenticolia bacterium]|nr:isoprenylcysteine carboxylmethyltransferase family protein [Candidatus Polarisedimenticolia bacterium]